MDRKRFSHPDAGDLELVVHTFDVRSAPGQSLVVYQAEPGSDSATALRILGSLAATDRATGPPAAAVGDR